MSKSKSKSTPKRAAKSTPKRAPVVRTTRNAAKVPAAAQPRYCEKCAARRGWTVVGRRCCR